MKKGLSRSWTVTVADAIIEGSESYETSLWRGRRRPTVGAFGFLKIPMNLS